MGKKSAAIVKRDTKENWRKSKYIPEVGVIIIMDCEDGSIELMFGDGDTPVNELPNLLNDTRGAAKIVDGNTLIL
jgi:hypothetical protein